MPPNPSIPINQSTNPNKRRQATGGSAAQTTSKSQFQAEFIGIVRPCHAVPCCIYYMHEEQREARPLAWLGLSGGDRHVVERAEGKMAHTTLGAWSRRIWGPLRDWGWAGTLAHGRLGWKMRADAAYEARQTMDRGQSETDLSLSLGPWFGHTHARACTPPSPCRSSGGAGYGEGYQPLIASEAVDRIGW